MPGNDNFFAESLVKAKIFMVDDSNNIEIIKTRNIFLKEGVVSDDIVLVDEVGGNMYFTFELKYVPDLNEAQTRVRISDDFHAKVVIETQPFATTSLPEPFNIGSYGNGKDFLIDFKIFPVMQDGTHSATITFYTSK